MKKIDYTKLSIGERLKFVRVEILKISLETFSMRLGMKSRSSMSRYERSGFTFSDRIIKQICSEFLINEHWLRTGEGDIFQSYIDDLKDICEKYNIDSNSEKVIRNFIALEQVEREAVSKFLIKLGEDLKENVEVLLPSVKHNTKSTIKIVEDTEPEESIEIPLYTTKASAGIGKYLGDNDPFELIKFPLNPKTRKADFAVNIDGDSMEPLIQDGETIFVKSMAQIELNQIGLFLYNEEVFCKRLIIDRKRHTIILRSENDYYDDIIIEDLSQLRTLGLVLR